MMVRSPWRTLLYDALAQVELSGEVIDLGGSRKSEYIHNLKGQHSLTMANLEAEAAGDMKLDLEKPFAITNDKYDAVLCINVLEHIYNYQNVISETRRILKSGGKAVFAVPFLVQVHPSPNDHWRFTGDTLERLFKNAGFSEVKVEPIGEGVLTATAQIKFNLLHFSLVRLVVIKCANFVDRIFSGLIKSKMYSRDYYPLGYVVTARK
ncbi:methyltransferase domain-containing protein [Candidatus Kaiserbacteria bacterium]|nr:methyltransferase domain-containing protein [Candidatus Kaiserbacteria bacterium]